MHAVYEREGAWLLMRRERENVTLDRGARREASKASKAGKAWLRAPCGGRATRTWHGHVCSSVYSRTCISVVSGSVSEWWSPRCAQHDRLWALVVPTPCVTRVTYGPNLLATCQLTHSSAPHSALCPPLHRPSFRPHYSRMSVFCYVFATDIPHYAIGLSLSGTHTDSHTPHFLSTDSHPPHRPGMDKRTCSPVTAPTPVRRCA